MMSSGILRSVAPVRTDVSEELSASFIRVTRIGELGTTLAVTCIVPSSPILITLMEALSSSETSVLTGATLSNTPEDTILHSHRRKNLKFHVTLIILRKMNAQNSLIEEPKEIRDKERSYVYQRKILKVFQSDRMNVWTGFSWVKTGASGIT
jgi:hypothetical protein